VQRQEERVGRADECERLLVRQVTVRLDQVAAPGLVERILLAYGQRPHKVEADPVAELGPPLDEPVERRQQEDRRMRGVVDVPRP
jgi:hypothetical protein